MGRRGLENKSEAGYVLLDVLVGFAVLAIGATGVYSSARNISTNIQKIQENTAYIAELEVDIAEKTAQFIPALESAE